MFNFVKLVELQKVVQAKPDVCLEDAVRDAMIISLTDHHKVILHFGDQEFHLDPDLLIKQIIDMRHKRATRRAQPKPCDRSNGAVPY